jgi:putative transcriptional regulator
MITDTILSEVIMYNSGNYGKVNFKLWDMLKNNNMSKNSLSVKSGVRFDTIHRYCKGDIVRVDLDVICRLCKALDCNIEEIIEYKK